MHSSRKSTWVAIVPTAACRVLPWSARPGYPVSPRERRMILEQHYLGCLSQASYLIGDESTGAAAVVDPRRDVDLYLDEAKKRGLVLRHVILTHFHADFVAGHLELRERTGATIHLGARARAAYP